MEKSGSSPKQEKLTNPEEVETSANNEENVSNDSPEVKANYK